MFKPTILVVPVLFVAMSGPSLAGDRDVAAALPCNSLCERWMAMAKPTAAVDLHPTTQPVAATATAVAPPAPRVTTVAASVPPTAPPRPPSLPASAPLPPRRPVVMAALRPPHEQHAMLMSHPQPVFPTHIPAVPTPVPVALVPLPAAVVPQPPPATPQDPARQLAAEPERTTGPAPGDRPVTKPIDFVLPPLDQLPSSQPITVPPALDVIAAVLLAGQTQP